eukprot:1261252-Rhodomonas_salina.1
MDFAASKCVQTFRCCLTTMILPQRDSEKGKQSNARYSSVYHTLLLFDHRRCPQNARYSLMHPVVTCRSVCYYQSESPPPPNPRLSSSCRYEPSCITCSSFVHENTTPGTDRVPTRAYGPTAPGTDRARMVLPARARQASYSPRLPPR